MKIELEVSRVNTGGNNRALSWNSLGLGFMAHYFDVVSVRTNDESCIVVRVVIRAQFRRAIVFASGLHSRAIESVDLVTIFGPERQVKTGGFLLRLVQDQRSFILQTKLYTITRRSLLKHSYTERFECLEKERFAYGKVGDSEFNMVKHKLWCVDLYP